MTRYLVLACASLLSLQSARAQFAHTVVAYDPGTDPTPTHTDASAALGEPSRLTPDPFGGPVDPFNAPWQSGQIVSIGTGGSLTVQFDAPIANHALNPFGIDFIIFGAAGFQITNAVDDDFNFIGTPATDSALYAQNPGQTRVSVSADNVNYFTLDMSLAPVVDAYFPTDGQGDFHQPLSPGLVPEDFAGLTLEGIRSLYGGSAGGAGFDLSWARDSENNPVDLASISFIRVEVLSGKSEIDGFAAVPEPATLALLLGAGALGIIGWARRKQA